jgi:predicted nucleic acid-binding protein
MKYLFDTDTLIDVLEDRDQVRTHIAAMIEAGDEVAMCPITIAELYSGLSEKKRLKWENWLTALPYWPISREAARQAGITRKSASDQGRTLSISDSFIAAVARENDATVLTSNTKDYPTKDVLVMSLREAA